MGTITGPQRTDNPDGRLGALRVQGHYLSLGAAVVLVVGFVERFVVGAPPGPHAAWRRAAPVCALSLALIGGHWLDQRAALHPLRRADPVLVALSLATSLCLFLIVIATLNLSAAWDPDALTAYGAALGLGEVACATRWFYATEGDRLVDQRVSPRIVWRDAARHLASAALYVLSADAASLPLSPRLALICRRVWPLSRRVVPWPSSPPVVVSRNARDAASCVCLAQKRWNQTQKPRKPITRETGGSMKRRASGESVRGMARTAYRERSEHHARESAPFWGDMQKTVLGKNILHSVKIYDMRAKPLLLGRERDAGRAGRRQRRA